MLHFGGRIRLHGGRKQSVPYELEIETKRREKITVLQLR